MKTNVKTYLSMEEVCRLASCRLDVDDCKMICADDLLQIVPWTTYIGKELCNLNISTDIIDGDATVIVSYDSVKNGWICATNTGETLVEALYETVLYCHENGLIDDQYYKYNAKKPALKSIEPIIKDGRIVSDITFATRFNNFLKNITVHDAASEEELDYMKLVAARLLQLQKETVEDESEEKYFSNLA